VVGHILAHRGHAVAVHRGNYSAFERQRAEKRLAQQQAMFEKQQREIAHLQSFVDRFRAKATKARQAQSRIKALERMERIAAAHVDTPFTFRFFEPAACPDPLLNCSSAPRPATVDARPGRTSSSESCAPGERIGLLGRNGAGKSTLIKTARRRGATRSAAHAKEGQGLRIGYFAQHQLEQLRPTNRRCSTCSASTRAGASRNCATTSAASTSAATWRRAPSSPSPAARNRGWRWPLLIWQRPTCCCSTSRPTTSTSKCARR
jgi:ATP-binding cassette subfamily F protein 3